jgi:hypothetical protein
MLEIRFIQAITKTSSSLSDREIETPPLGVRAATGNRLRSYWTVYQAELPLWVRLESADGKLSALFLGQTTLAHTSPLEFFVAPETCPSENN